MSAPIPKPIGTVCVAALVWSNDVSVVPIKWALDGRGAADFATSSRVIFGINRRRQVEL
jgi:hypothetical protein